MDISWGPMFFVVGLILTVFSPLLGVVAARNGNIVGAIMWWMMGTTLGIGLLITRMSS